MPSPVFPLDLNFLHMKDAIAAYVIPHRDGAALVETGPGSTVEALTANLAEHGLTPKDVTHVFLTHIHLDHAGAAGWMAQQGAQIFVHPVGAPHLINPEKLISSAKRIYQNKMDFLWGQFLAVPEEKLFNVEDGETIPFGNQQITALHTPGHAEHHIAWVFEDICFSGDVGGVRIPGPLYMRMPFVPPELNFEKWYASLERLGKAGFKRIAPTHFGIFDDGDTHVRHATQTLVETVEWMETIMPSDPPIEYLRELFVTFCREQALQMGLDEDILNLYEIANPTWMGADGIARYWKKFRVAR
jgi:glyoxylase-like metal-dependent hydrolase (beta-lactamase superfamily II)